MVSGGSRDEEQIEKTGQKPVAVLGEHAFGMELDAHHRMVVVTQGHDRAALGGGRNL